MRAIAKDMVGFNLSIHLGDQFRFRGRLEMASDESCERAAKTFDVFTKLVKTSMQNQDGGKRPDRMEFFENLEIKPRKKDLLFNVTAPSSLIKQLSENDRKDPNSPRNRVRRAREEERKRLEAEGGEPSGTDDADGSSKDSSESGKPSDDESPE